MVLVEFFRTKVSTPLAVGKNLISTPLAVGKNLK
jgi:hypothetical protein